MSTFIVVGTGVFGASTALELVRAGNEVVVLERSADGYAAPDAASNDLNKIVRADYSDPHYRDLAKTAISVWRRSDLLSPFYHEVGVLFHTGPSADVQASKAYVEGAVASAAAPSDREQPHPGQALKPAAHIVSSLKEVTHCFPVAARSRLGKMAADMGQGTSMAYYNPRGGWAEADKATRAVLDEAKRLGAKVMANAHVDGLLFEDRSDAKKVTGVRCADGRHFHVQGQGQVVLCVGGWAESLLHKVLESSRLSQTLVPTWSSAQCVVTVQLTEEQRKAFAKTPVVLEFASGFYLFEPSADGLMKIAIHSSGYRHPLPSTQSTPPSAFPTFASGTQSAQQPGPRARSTPAHMLKKGDIPGDQAQRMMEQLRYVYPELADAPIVYNRICFYSESLDENWIIDRVPGLKGLIVASGDSGHGFKFLPILGNLVCARMGIPQAGTLTAHQDRVFSFDHHADVHRQSVQSQRESSTFKARL